MAVQTANDRSVGELVQQLSAQTSELVRQELRLAQLEMQEKGRHAGVGAGLFGGAGLMALYGVGFVLAGAAVLLGTAIAQWLALVVVGAALLIVAGIAALVGRTEIRRAAPLVPEQAIETTRQDIHHVRASANR